MKVVHIINRLIGGGAEVMVPQIHREHLAAGVDSWILSMETGDDRGTEKVVSFGERLPRWKEPFRLRKLLRGMAEESPIDVVHTHLTQSQMFGKYAVRGLKNRPALVTTEHDTSNRRRELPGGRIFDRCLYRGYDRIICISDGVKESMEDWVPQTAGKLTTIANGVDLRPFDALNRSVDLKETVQFLSVGRVIPKKNFALAIRALAGRADLDWTYTIVGTGEQTGELEELAKSHGLGDRVRFAGYCEDVVPYYASSDVFLLPSLWEGFGLVAAEAMGAGLPVLASDVPGLAELVGRAGDTGVLLPVDDVGAWTEAIAAILKSPQDRVRLGEAARVRARNFSVEHTAASYLNLYEELKSK